MAYTATSQAIGYALRLAAERDIPPAGPYRREVEVRQLLHRIQTGDGGLVSGKQCSTVIDWLKTIDRRQAPAAVTATRGVIPRVRPGCFIMAGRIWVVVERQDERGVYAKLLTESPERIRDVDGERVPFDLTYDRDMSLRALADLTEDHRMTFAQAKDYMIRYGQCFAPAGRSVCGLRLKAADSVALSIGPVCGPKFPGYHEAVEELRAARKHALYEQARDELGIGLSDVELYRAAGPHVSTVAGIERKLDRTPATV
jgi:hypothetical protein